MNTSILTVVLAGALLAGQNGNATWQNSYATAQRMGAEQQKPVLVVIGSGANGWSKVIGNGAPSPEVTAMLAKFACVYIDASTPEGQRLAKSFEINGNGLVISDKTGAYQAFWHQGDMTNQNMVRCLETYADQRAPVQATATLSTIRDSAYPPQTSRPEPINLVAEGIAPPSNNVAPIAWQSSYNEGQRIAASQRKPLVVVFGSGPKARQTMSAEATQLLNNNYVSVYVDTATPAGKKFAETCEIMGNNGIIISDRAGATQAFWHQGDLSNDQLVRSLTRYSDPQINLQTTETANTVRTSLYPASSTSSDWGTSLGGGSSYCPSCNNARGRR